MHDRFRLLLGASAFLASCGPASSAPVAVLPAATAATSGPVPAVTIAAKKPPAPGSDDEDFTDGWTPDPNADGLSNCRSQCLYSAGRCRDYMAKHNPNKPSEWAMCDACMQRCQ